MLRLQEPCIEIKICQISVRDLIEWLCQQVGQIGQAQWDFAGHGHWIPKPRHDGPPRSNQNDLVTMKTVNTLHILQTLGPGPAALKVGDVHIVICMMTDP